MRVVPSLVLLYNMSQPMVAVAAVAADLEVVLVLVLVLHLVVSVIMAEILEAVMMVSTLSIYLKLLLEEKVGDNNCKIILMLLCMIGILSMGMINTDGIMLLIDYGILQN